MGIPRNSFYAWKQRLSNPSPRAKVFAENVLLFKEYHAKYPSHGYRWLNAKIRLDTGLVISNVYAHRCCKAAEIKSEAKRCKYKAPRQKGKVFPNLLSAELQVDGPLQCIVSDMTAFWFKGIYYELTLYMDYWNNEILKHSLSDKRGDRMTYLSGLKDVIEFKKKYPDQKLILHTDGGSVYASKAFNDLLPAYGIIHSMSRPGTPTDNATMEAINGWMKAEMFIDLHVTGDEPVEKQVDEYIRFFNEERPAYALNYLTPKQYRELYVKNLK